MSRCGLLHLVVQKVPDSLHQAGHELPVAEQHTDKFGGPEVFSGMKEIVSDQFHMPSLFIVIPVL